MTAIKKEEVVEDGIFDSAIAGAKSMLEVITKLKSEIDENLKSSREFTQKNGFKNVSDVKNFSTVQKEVNKNIELRNQLDKERLRLEQRLAKAQSEEGKELAKLNLSVREQNRLNRESAILVNKATGAYKKLSTEFNINFKKAQDLLASNKSLTKSQQDFIKSVNEMNVRLKAIDKTLGSSRRFVGEYERANYGLRNSINQITRELPAFTFSAQTGFLAISNNIPILVDEISKLRAENDKLIKQGKPTKRILTQLATSFFSLQTALSLGVTLLTVYGSEIVDLAKKMFSITKNIDAAAEAQEKYNKALKDAELNVISEQVRLEALVRQAQDEKRSRGDRLDAIKELTSKYPEYFKDLENETDLLNQTGKGYELVAARINELGKSRQILEQINKTREERIKIEQELAGQSEKEIELRRRIKDENDLLVEARRQRLSLKELNILGARKSAFERELKAIVENREEAERLKNVENELFDSLENLNIAEAKFIKNKKKEKEGNIELIKSTRGMNKELREFLRILAELEIINNEESDAELERIDGQIKARLKLAETNEKIAQREEKLRIARKRAQQKVEDDFRREFSKSLLTEIQMRKDAELGLFDEQIKQREEALETQRNLAERGLNNQIVFEEQKLAEAQANRKKFEEQARKEIETTKKLELFFENLISNIRTNRENEVEGGDLKALSDATAQTFVAAALAKTIAGAFATGVENFKGKGTETSDSNLIAFSKGESVITAKGTKENSGLPTAMNEGRADDWIMQNWLPKYIEHPKVSEAIYRDSSKTAMVNHAQMAVLISEMKEISKTNKQKSNGNSVPPEVIELMKSNTSHEIDRAIKKLTQKRL